MRHTFKKEERLTGKKAFDTLFQSGKSMQAYPFRLLWKEAPLSSSSVRLGISVPKRSFAKAVDRNYLKRKIREAYRKNKEGLCDFLKNKKVSIDFMMIYIAKEDLPYREIERKMIQSLQKLFGKLQ